MESEELDKITNEVTIRSMAYAEKMTVPIGTMQGLILLIREFKEVLEFYAKESNHTRNEFGWEYEGEESIVEADRGNRARDVLPPKKRKEENKT